LGFIFFIISVELISLISSRVFVTILGFPEAFFCSIAKRSLLLL